MLATVFCLAMFLPGVQKDEPKRFMRPEDYKGWETIVNRDISDDGHWLWYQIAVSDGDGSVTIQNNDDPRRIRVRAASNAAFSDDSKWCAYLLGPLKAEADKLREEKKPIITKLVLRNLDSGSEQTFESVMSFYFLRGSHAILARCFPPADKPDAPSDLLVISLPSASVLPINGVEHAAANLAGTQVALATKSADGAQGVELLDPQTLAIRPLSWGKDDVADLAWSKNGNALAYLVGHKDDDREGDFNRVVEVTGLPSDPQLKGMDPDGASWLAKGSRISDSSPVQLNDDGSAVAFGIGDWWPKTKPDDKVAHPEIWNTKDLRTVPEQRVSAGADRNRVDLAVWWPASDKVQKVSNGWLESASLLKGFKTAVLEDSSPYRMAANNGWFYSDVYLVDT